MPRAKDLDTIAPDNLDIVTSQPTKPSKTHTKKTKRRSTKAKKVSISKKQIYRKQVYKLLGRTKHSLSSFLARPKIFDFDDRNQNEEIILVLRRHWITNLNWILVFMFMIFFPLFLTIVPILDSFPINYNFVFIFF